MGKLPSSITLPWVLLLLLLNNASAHEGDEMPFPEGSCGASLHSCIDMFEEAFGGPGVIEELGVQALTGDKASFFGLAQFLPQPQPPLGPGGQPIIGPGGEPPPLGPGGVPPPLGQGGGLAPPLQASPGSQGVPPPGLPPPGLPPPGLPPPGLPPPTNDGTLQRRKRGALQRQNRHDQNLQNLIKSALNLKAIPSRFRRASPPGPLPPGSNPGGPQGPDPFANFTITDFMMFDITNSWQLGIMNQEKTCQFLRTVDHVKFNSAHQCVKLRSTDETCAADFAILKQVLAEDPPEDMYQQVETRMCGSECAGVKEKLESVTVCNAVADASAPANVLINNLLTQITLGQDYSETCRDLRNILTCPMRKMGCCQILMDQLDTVLRQQLPVQLLDLCKVKYEADHCRQKNANLIAAGSTVQFSMVAMAIAILSLILV